MTSAPAATRLRIPPDAARVLVFCESSHWDTNWLKTSEEYFASRLVPILTKVLHALDRDPERIYCVESVFFLKLFWERHPHLRDRIRDLVRRRQLRISSSSFTTPDTLLPHPEAVLRDYHLGQQWLRRAEIEAHPTTAYFPDNFGHSPHLPSLMKAVGVTSVGLTRVDGMYFMASDFRRRSAFPLAGSTAERLQKEYKTLDFVWRDDGGAEVLCHWNAFGYFQGDMLAHAGVIRWNGHVVGFPWRTRRHVAGRIDGFVRQLGPLSRTRYLLCPIGMDFNDPIDDLRDLLVRYNDERYPSTGTWSVLAGLDDYFELVGERRSELPVLAVDPNPYWMGFYASRPEMKQRSTRAARQLVLVETLAALAPHRPEVEASLRDGWHNLVLLNHHDAITGTSPDRVCAEEQRGWLDAAEACALRVLDLSGHAPDQGGAPASRHEARWWKGPEGMHVEASGCEMSFSQRRGGCLTRLVTNGREQIRGLGLDLVAYSDDGGLWRLGHEYNGGRFVARDRVSRRAAGIDVVDSGRDLSVVIRASLCGRPFKRTVTWRPPFLFVLVEGEAARRFTVTCRSDLAMDSTSLSMDTLGGHIERPRERVHQPTFWPVPSLVSLTGATQALHVGFEAPSAVSLSPRGTLEWIVARNATKERAFRVLPVLAHPIGGTAQGPQSHHAALFVCAPGESARALRGELEVGWLPREWRHLVYAARRAVRCDDPTISLAAAKRADVGEGLIVRLACGHALPRTVRLWIDGRPLSRAARCDAREEDLGVLAVEKGCALVPLDARLTSVRLVV